MSVPASIQQPKSVLVISTVAAICLMLFLFFNKNINWEFLSGASAKPYVIAFSSIALGIGLHGLLLYRDVQKKWARYEKLAPTYAFASVMQMVMAVAILLACVVSLFLF